MLRQDSADFRLTPKSYELGLATEKRMRRMEQKQKQSLDFVDFFKNTSVAPDEANPILESKGTTAMKQSGKLFKVFARPQIDLEDVLKIKSVANYVDENGLDKEVLEQAEIQVKYAGYIEKEKNNADKLNRLEDIKIPENFDYSKLKSLSFEAKEKMSQIKPATVSQASRISGVSPSDISVLLVYMGR